MGFDLARFIPGLLLSIFILTALVVGYTDIARGYGSNAPVMDNNSTFDSQFNNTLTAADKIGNTIESKGVDSTNTFFPAVATIFAVLQLIKSSITDTTQIIEAFTYHIGGGPLVVMLKTILITTLGVTIAFIVLLALFRITSFKLGG